MKEEKKTCWTCSWGYQAEVDMDNVGQDGEDTSKRITCPECKGEKEITVGRSYEPHYTTESGYELVTVDCHTCKGVGQVCVCPACDGSREREGRPCLACDAKGHVPVDEWDRAVDKGHSRLMEEHRS